MMRTNVKPRWGVNEYMSESRNHSLVELERFRIDVGRIEIQLHNPTTITTIAILTTLTLITTNDHELMVISSPDTNAGS